MNPFPKLDHLLTKVSDSHAAGQWFEARGFTVSPVSIIASMGIQNRLVLFNSGVAGTANFIELMAIQPGAQVQDAMGRLLSSADGTRSIVLVTEDAHACASHLSALGFAPGEVHHVQRKWELPGETLDLEFDVLLPIQAPLKFNVCKYFTLQHYLRDEWTTHANGVSHLSAIHGVVKAAEHAAETFARVLGRVPEKVTVGHHKIVSEAVSLHVFESAAYEEFSGKLRPEGIVGYALESKNLDLTFDYLHKTNTPIERLGPKGGLIEAFGNDVFIRDLNRLTSP
jgi:Glyoxalase-like domain